MLSESNMRTYIIQNPNNNDIDEILRKCINIYNKKYETNLVSCLLKLLTTKNRVRNFRINARLNVG